MSRISADLYRDIRTYIFALGFKMEYDWCEGVRAPASADDFAGEAIWVILCSGMKAEIARSIERKVRKAIFAGRPVSEVFGHTGKAGAIAGIWEHREQLYAEYQVADDKLAYLENLPWIGPITKFHLAKNLGMDCAKPDRWLWRLAAATGEGIDALCQRLARETGDRVATVDLVLWRACNQGVLIPRSDGLGVDVVMKAPADPAAVLP